MVEDSRSSLRLLLAVAAAAAVVVGVGPQVRAPAGVAHAATAQTAVEVALRAGLVIDRSTTVRPGTYRIASASLDGPAIVIRGHDIVVDFDGAVLEGSPGGEAPDRFAGLAVLVDGGERITIRNARIRGYKVAILARHVRGLTLTGNDVSYNWKPRLYSGVEHESFADWLTYHHNERDEWLRYGAGIYLSDVDGASIDRNRAVQGQNGLMATRSRALRIWNNEFSFLSGIGVGLYRTTDSTIMHNRIDWCVRGYSEGFYNRGQDSAGLLMYEQSSRNVVAYNSVTHGGDGLFLWAGQSTMDTGEGGSNDNLFYGNDFSFAPANGIEATFSRNTFAANRIEGNWHGVWGGYSFDSVIADNTFVSNDEGIAIEHGRDNTIVGNTFTGGGVAVRLWMNRQQDPSWAYVKRHETSSRDYLIAGNTFDGSHVGLQLTDTPGVVSAGNRFERVGADVERHGDTGGYRVEQTAPARAKTIVPPARMADGVDAMIPPADRRGRDAIIVDDWGPYDWRSPKLWPAGRSDASPLKLRVLGPPGRWTLASIRGGTVSARAGEVPGEIAVAASPGRFVDVDVALRYVGGEVVTATGTTIPAGRPYVFRYSRFFAPIDWTVRFYDFGATPDAPAAAASFAKVLAGTPVRTERTDRIDYISSRAIAPGVPADHVAVAAEGTVTLPPGHYRLRTISDEGVRVWVDRRLAIDHWSPHESAADVAAIDGGRHRLRVEYYEATGDA
ncbi:MAG: NosD domain-containing protein, partial [Betaproteobacteria bacterium]